MSQYALAPEPPNGLVFEINLEVGSKMASACGICGRKLDQKDDPLSLDCGGDCWGCVGEIEADMGDERSLTKVREEFDKGLRPGWVDPGTELPTSD
ncbi:hypothetical protein [Duganella vulcania]|uniref:hypothetical protein n=1 Tax=Duganella vulcania TaxID=2692166 RepID=UPI001C2D2666|nr:hypothetical protein [Duganella vulcania]